MGAATNFDETSLKKELEIYQVINLVIKYYLVKNRISFLS